MERMNTETLAVTPAGSKPASDNITLIGMPGAGKSTLGVVLAKRLGYRFVDTDLLLQEGTGMLLSDLIERRGIEGFIEEENKLLAGLRCSHHVIATGGSAVYSEQGMENLKKLGRVVFIDIDMTELPKRLHTDLFTRGVVIRSGSTLQNLYDERRPLYQKYADITVNTVGLSTLEAVELLSDAIASDEQEKRR